MTNGDRHSVAETQNILSDPDELARREVENGIHQYDLAIDIIKTHVNDHERPFRLRSAHILQLNQEALKGIHAQAGTYRNSKVTISKSKHQPPEHFFVAEEVEGMCSYVNDRWGDASISAIHLAAYLMWRLNWIHPFADGNGRTSRIVSYLVLNIKLNGLLPGVPTIPEQIASAKQPYYDALEAADDAWASSGKVDVSAMEELISGMLAEQLLNAAKAASGD